MNNVAVGPAALLFGQDIPLARLCGLVGEQLGENWATVRMSHREELTNSRGDLHGGALTMLLDTALACAVRSHDPQRFGVVTIELTTHFLIPCSGDVRAYAQCQRRGSSLCFSNGEVRDSKGRLVALATGTFKLVERMTNLPD